MNTNAVEIGRHRLTRMGNGMLLVPNGDMTGEDARTVVDHVAAWFGVDETYYLLFDGKNLTTLSPDGRKAFAEWVQKRKAPEYVAYFNVGFAVSTLIFLMNNAARLFGRPANTKTFGTEAEARAWLTSVGARFES